jgi:sarcosine oxidase subunit delta
MRINCPYCGERGLDEFAYHGDATVTRPDHAAPDAMVEFVAYVYERTNPHSWHRELWYHSAGCQSWLVVTRHVTSHAIASVESAKDVALKRIAARREATDAGAIEVPLEISAEPSSGGRPDRSKPHDSFQV